MRTLKTLRPGQDVTKELLTRCGKNLLCVPYRYGESTGERVKTVGADRPALLARFDTGPTAGTPDRLRYPPSRRLGRPSRSRNEGRPKCRLSAGRTTARGVGLRIHFREIDLRRRVKSAGGRWDPERRLWLLRRDQAGRHGLLHSAVTG